MVLVTATAGGPLRTDFNFDRLTEVDSVIVEQRSSSLIIDVDGLRYAFSGSDVRYNSFDEPISGTITGINILRDGILLFQASPLSIPAATFYQATFAPNNPLTSLVLAGNDELRGGALDDNFSDLLGHNNLFGGAGADTLVAGGGNDHLYGQSASGGDDGADSIRAGGGSDYVQGNAGNDVIDGGGGSDRLIGGADSDTLSGGAGNDAMNGSRGNDSVNGGADNDLMRGGQGNDTLDGGDGNDVMLGDRDTDQLTGGAGQDIFVFEGINAPSTANALDRILDFQQGQDHLAIGFLPRAVLSAAVDPFAGAAGTPYTTALGQAQSMLDSNPGGQEVAFMTLQTVQRQTYMFWDADGNGRIDSAFEIGAPATPYSISDFL
jgi:serralysin